MRTGASRTISEALAPDDHRASEPLLRSLSHLLLEAETTVRAAPTCRAAACRHQPAVDSAARCQRGATQRAHRGSAALQSCAERSHGVLLMTARSSAATIKATSEQGGAS